MTHEYNKALCDACKNGYISVVKLLLENGADPTYNDHDAIRVASFHGYENIVLLLLQDGRSIPNNECLIWASYIRVVEILLQDGRVEPTSWAIDHATGEIKEMLIGYKYRVDGQEYRKMKNEIKT
jgi:hypothetical protein